MTLVYTLITILVFILLLCIFITISEHFLGLRGEAEVCINSENKLKSKRGTKLLQVLAENNIFLPAACGSKGSCGRCKVKVLSGGGYLTSLEKALLSENELKDNFRLACQVKLREDIDLNIPQELLNVRGFKAKLIEKDNLAFGIKKLCFKLENGEKIDFKPGQYVQIIRDLPRENVIRAYSFSSSPKVKDEFTLDVQLVEGGLMSTYLHSLELGSVINFCGAFGDMFVDLDKHNYNNILLIAGGVGLAPMRSIINYLKENSFKGNVVLFHGVRSKKYLYCENEYKKLQKEYENFKYYPVLSEPALEDGWIGKTGLVTEIFSEYLNETELSSDSIEAYLCGPSKMMEAAEKLLLEKGIEKKSIHSDPFSF